MKWTPLVMLLVLALVVSGCTVVGLDFHAAGFGVELGIKCNGASAGKTTEPPAPPGVSFKLMEPEKPV
jgi:hypothetical protein